MNSSRSISPLASRCSSVVRAARGPLGRARREQGPDRQHDDHPESEHHEQHDEADAPPHARVAPPHHERRRYGPGMDEHQYERSRDGQAVLRTPRPGVPAGDHREDGSMDNATATAANRAGTVLVTEDEPDLARTVATSSSPLPSPCSPTRRPGCRRATTASGCRPARPRMAPGMRVLPRRMAFPPSREHMHTPVVRC